MSKYFCPLRAGLENKNCVKNECMWWLEVETPEDDPVEESVCAIANISMTIAGLGESTDQVSSSLKAILESLK